MRRLPLLVATLAACSRPAAPIATTSSTAPASPVATEPQNTELSPETLAILRRLTSIEDRLARLELAAAEANTADKSDALKVSYNPSKTTLEARTVQDALDEIATRVGRLDGGPMPLGPAGPGLFEIKGKGKGPGGQGPGGMGPPGGGPQGGKGPPPGGPQGGPQGGKGPPPGGGNGQPGGGDGGQKGGW